MSAHHHIMHENPLGRSAVEQARDRARQLEEQLAQREEQVAAAVFLGLVLFFAGVALGVFAF